ncbi:MAG: 4-alpha-glucanotransferase [Synergistaceae bacterium]|jgi:4-alpha-glucanotransferase|nr:4-alpha-glucanotransferase [Synergistaceae bacterium]
MSFPGNRKSGVLLHISSLPGSYGIGDMGRAAVEFADILADSGVGAWQVLPLVPTNGISSHSPYSSQSAFAGNTNLIDLCWLADQGLADPGRLAELVLPQSDAVDFDAASQARRCLLHEAYANFRRDDAYKTRFRKLSDDFWNFCVREAYWLEDYALFCVLKEIENQASWGEWRPQFRDRDWGTLDALKSDAEISRKLDIRRFEQFIFFRQMGLLREECRRRGIELIGDLPIYVAYDSSDVWGHRELFMLDESGRPSCVAGVPPDYFSETGQRWGNPIYRWDRMREDGYKWWLERIGHTLRCVDTVRLDHFRGFMGYWEIPEEEPTAVNGEWRRGPGRDLFYQLRRSFGRSEDGRMPFIAEDLGVMTPDVRETMEEFGLPGMKVLHFAFGEGMPQNPYVPHNHRRDSVVYVGTHDNNTTVGWWEEEGLGQDRANFQRYIGARNLTGREAADAMIRMALSSPAELAVITAQDILRLGLRARMNTPSTVEGNWAWKLKDLDGLRNRAGEIRELSTIYGRFQAPEKPDGESRNDG